MYLILILTLASTLLERIGSSPINVESYDNTPKSKSLVKTKKDLESLDKLLQSSDTLRKRLTGVLEEYGLVKKNDKSTAKDADSVKELHDTALSDRLMIAAGNPEDTPESDKSDSESNKDPIAEELESASESVEPAPPENDPKSEAEELNISQLFDYPVIPGRTRSVSNPPEVNEDDDNVTKELDEIPPDSESSDSKSSKTQKKDKSFLGKLEGALRDAVKNLDTSDTSKVNSGTIKQTDDNGIINNAFDFVLRSREYHDLASAADDSKTRHIGAEAPKNVEQSIPEGEVKLKGENADDLVQDANAIEGIKPYESDIDLDSVDKKIIAGSSNKKIEKRNVQLYVQKLWITRVVPYEIDGSKAASTSKILQAFKTIEDATCIKFRKRVYTDNNWLRIFHGVGCHSGIGRKYYKKGPTDVSLGTLCDQQSVMVHEFLHSLGFFHEQSRPDRNSFLKIFYENIRPGMESNFERIKSSEGNVQDTEYDFSSIMHYSRTSFTRDGKNTMESLFEPNKKLGGIKLSKLDIQEINQIYQCHLKGGGWSVWSSWTPCIKHWSGKCKKIKQRYCFDKDRSRCPGADKYGVEDKEVACSKSECYEKFDGHWGNWGKFGQCSKTCDEGKYTRSRRCNNPAPKGGKACKGASTDTEVCRIKKCKAEWYDTSFSDGWGRWEQDSTDKFDWKRGYGGTGTLWTGPAADHTTGNSYYVYVDAAPPRRHGEIARLQMQMPANFGIGCLSFFYSMNGKDTGSLDLFTKTNSGKFVNYFNKAGHQGKAWRNKQVQLKNSNEPYQIIFEAKLGFSRYSDMAIDDVYIDKGTCVKTGMEGCQNHNPSCVAWTYEGECHKNSAWMNRECCQSCTALGACTNKNKNCEFWAFKKNQCISNAKWMWANCCQACKGCLNQAPECETWKKAGECPKNPTWMNKNCPKSCGVCAS